MNRFIEECSRTQSVMFPEQLEDYVNEENPVRVIHAFVDALDLRQMGFNRVDPKATGRPGYRPSTLLKLYVYDYLNRIQSSRRLERESQRNVELMWLICKLTPDFKTIADFRKDNGPGIQSVCKEFVDIYRKLELFARAIVAIDGSKFKGVNSKQRNDTQASMKRRIARTDKHLQEYMDALDAEDKAHPDKQLSETDPDARLMKQSRSGSLVGYNVKSAVDVDTEETKR